MKPSSGRVTPELITKIKEAVNLVDVIGEHVVLRKAGANFSGLCPFHAERSPSFSVSETKQLYHCYGCKKSGDLLTFFQEIHGLSFMDAIEELAERGRVALPKDWSGNSSDDPEQKARRDAAMEKQQLAYKLNRFVAAWMHTTLPKLPYAEQYFRKRGVDADLARAFYVGAAPAGWDALAQHLVQTKAPIELAVELGLIRPSKKQQAQGPGYFDLFRNRAMFPILDLRGRVAGFGGRMMPPPPGSQDSNAAAAGDKEAPKYINSSDSFVFQKGKLAYGLYQAQKHVRLLDEVVLVEGYFDVLALHAAGFQNAVAICGTSLTYDHLNMFGKLGSKVTLLLDGDRAGIAATERAMETGLERGQVLYGASMPVGLDPDEVLFDQETGKATSDGHERMKAILAGARPLLDTRIDECILEAQQGPEARTLALKQIAGWLSIFKDPVGREIRMESVQKSLEVSRSLLERAMGEGQGYQAQVQTKRGPEAIRPNSPISSPKKSGGPVAPVANPVARPQNPKPAMPSDSQQEPPPGHPASSSSGENRAQARPVPRSGGAATRNSRPKTVLSNRDKVLLGALVRGGQYAELMSNAQRSLPPKLLFADLFDYPPASEFVAALLEDPGFLENFRAGSDQVLQERIDPQVRSTITEALIAGEAPYQISEVKLALERGLKRALERFSQQIMAAIAEAQANKDAGLEAELMKEYLDVKRKIKEFTSFYDEA